MSSVLRIPLFRWMLFASFCSFVGDWMYEVGQTWLMLTLRSAPSYVSWLAVASYGSFLVFVYPFGLLADRVDRPRLLALSFVFMALAAAVVGALAAHGSVAPWMLVVAAAALGFGEAAMTPTWSALLADIVPRAQLGDAVTWGSIAFNAARACGPGVAGIAIHRAGVPTTFFANALSFVPPIWVMLAVGSAAAHGPLRAAARESVRSARDAEMWTTRAMAPARWVLASPPLRAVFLATALVSLFAGIPILLPAYVKHALHGTPSLIGWVLGAIGVGAMLSGTILGRMRARFGPKRTIVASSALYAALVLLAVRLATPRAVVVLFFFAGMAWIALIATLNATTQLLAPSRMRASVSALASTWFTAIWMISGALAGFIADRVGEARTFTGIAASGLVAAACLAMLPLPSRPVEDVDDVARGG